MPSHTLKIAILALCALFTLPASALELEKGKTYVLLSNLHPDMNKRVLYTINYNLPALMPMCDEITVVKKKKSKLIFEWKGQEYTFVYDGHTKKSGTSFDDALSFYIGESCDKKKLASLSEIDRKGIRTGLPHKGMTREAIVYAMGRPPIHANPDLDAASYTYWINRFKRKVIDFNEAGIVSDIRL